MHGVSGGVECLPDPFDQPLHVSERWDTADVDPVHDAALPELGSQVALVTRTLELFQPDGLQGWPGRP